MFRNHISHAGLGYCPPISTFEIFLWLMYQVTLAIPIEQIRLTSVCAMFGLFLLSKPNNLVRCVDRRTESSVKLHELSVCVSRNVEEVQLSRPFSG